MKNSYLCMGKSLENIFEMIIPVFKVVLKDFQMNVLDFLKE